MSNAVMDASLPEIGPTEFRLFRDLIQRHTGIWLREGKQVMLASRLARRLREHQMSSFADYYRYVEGCRDGGAELGEMINCVTTNKTSFFRERHHFAFLSETAVPEIAARSGTTRGGAATAKPAIHVWSAACSTGEEPYSIAITLLEWQLQDRGAMNSGWDMRIAASDIDTTVLEKAARGIYGEEELEGIDPAIRKKYFLRGKEDMAGCIRVKKHVAALVEFQRINLMDSSWPLNASFDAVFFRNALIYFRQETQDLFLRRIARRMKPGGYLFLGHAEHIPWLHDVFEPMQKTIYRLRSART